MVGSIPYVDSSESATARYSHLHSSMSDAVVPLNALTDWRCSLTFPSASMVVPISIQLIRLAHMEPVTIGRSSFASQFREQAEQTTAPIRPRGLPAAPRQSDLETHRYTFRVASSPRIAQRQTRALPITSSSYARPAERPRPSVIMRPARDRLRWISFAASKLGIALMAI